MQSTVVRKTVERVIIKETNVPEVVTLELSGLEFVSLVLLWSRYYGGYTAAPALRHSFDSGIESAWQKAFPGIDRTDAMKHAGQSKDQRPTRLVDDAVKFAEHLGIEVGE